MDDEIAFLDFQDILVIHEDQLARHGGLAGFNNEGGVQAAAEAPRQMMFGQCLHTDIAHMAAAYLFHFADAQHFLDGNKRTGAACCIIFLQVNGYDLDCTDMELYDITMRVANRLTDKDGLAAWIRDHLSPIAEEE